MRRMTAAGPPANRPPHIWFGASGGGAVGLATIGLALLFAVILAHSGAARADEEKIRLGEFIPATPPQPAPEATFTDLDGKPARLADFKGKPAVVNLWATWCQPCLKEMPSLEQLHSELAGKLIVAAVSEDRRGAETVRPFLAEKGLQGLAIYLDPKSTLSHAIAARGLPTSIVLDAEGMVVGRVEGAADWDSEAMLAVLRPLLDDANRALKKAAR